MQFVFYMNCISAHQLPLADGVSKIVGRDNFLYVDAEREGQPLQTVADVQSVNIKRLSDVGYEYVKNCDVLFTGMRDVRLFEYRMGMGLKTFYTSERWFKPIRLPKCLPTLLRNMFQVPGKVRMMVPKYIEMGQKVVNLLERGYGFVYLPIGVWAARDMATIARRDFVEKNEWSPGDCVEGLPNTYMWGDFVESSKAPNSQLIQSQLTNHNTIRVLWVGRMLDLKRVDTIIRAVGELSNSNSNHKLSLDIYGQGPEESRLKKLAAKFGNVVRFYPPVPIAEVRELMRSHDVYVLGSDAGEGWGAVVPESLEEGCNCVGTFEAGASATILPKENLFHAGDYRALAKILAHLGNNRGSIGKWSAAYAAGRLIDMV